MNLTIGSTYTHQSYGKVIFQGKDGTLYIFRVAANGHIFKMTYNEVSLLIE